MIAECEYNCTPDIFTQLAIFVYSGISCITFPSSSFPLACLLRFTPSLPQVPHCLKKKNAPDSSTCFLMFSDKGQFKNQVMAHR